MPVPRSDVTVTRRVRDPGRDRPGPSLRSLVTPSIWRPGDHRRRGRQESSLPVGLKCPASEFKNFNEATVSKVLNASEPQGQSRRSVGPRKIQFLNVALVAAAGRPRARRRAKPGPARNWRACDFTLPGLELDIGRLGGELAAASYESRSRRLDSPGPAAERPGSGPTVTLGFRVTVSRPCQPEPRLRWVSTDPARRTAGRGRHSRGPAERRAAAARGAGECGCQGLRLASGSP